MYALMSDYHIKNSDSIATLVFTLEKQFKPNMLTVIT